MELEYENDVRKFKLIADVPALNGHVVIENYVTAIKELDTVMPMTSFSMIRQAPPNAEKYDFSVVFQDGRSWVQMIRPVSPQLFATGPATPSIEWNVDQEIAKIQNFRARLIAIWSMYQVSEFSMEPK